MIRQLSFYNPDKIGIKEKYISNSLKRMRAKALIYPVPMRFLYSNHSKLIVAAKLNH